MSLRGTDLTAHASDEVRAALARLGRTEDLAFSPNGRWLVIPSFARDSVGLVGLDIEAGDGRPEVTITGVAELAPPGLDHPHGVDFVDHETIVVVNRHGRVSLLRLAVPDDEIGGAELVPVDLPAGGGFDHLHGPSAVAVAPGPDGAHEVLIGHRFEGILTRHVLHADGSGGFAVTANEVLLREGIVVVDGVTVSPDGAWLALSNPMHLTVELYERGSAPSDAPRPRCILRGASYPHGVRFSADSRHLFVADGSSPHVYVHRREGDTWRGVRHPVASVRVFDDEVFRRGRRNARDGGPKGIDLDPSGTVLAVTSEFERVAFYDVAAIVERVAAQPDDHDAEVGLELDLARAADERVEERIDALTGSTTYRVAQRLQGLRKLVPNRR